MHSLVSLHIEENRMGRLAPFTCHLNGLNGKQRVANFLPLSILLG